MIPMKKEDREMYLTRRFLHIYQKGIMEGINLNNNTDFMAIKMHVNGKADSFLKLAKKCIKDTV